MTSRTKLLVSSILLAFASGCSHGDGGTKTSSPAELKSANDSAKAQSVAEKLGSFSSAEFSKIVEQKGTDKIESAVLVFSKTESAGFQYSLELKLAGSESAIKYVGQTQPIADSNQMEDLTLENLGSGAFLSTKAEAGQKDQQCVQIKFDGSKNSPVSDVLLCENSEQN